MSEEINGSGTVFSAREYLEADRLARERRQEISRLMSACSGLNDIVVPVDPETLSSIENFVDLRKLDPNQAAISYPVLEGYRLTAVKEDIERSRK